MSSFVNVEGAAVIPVFDARIGGPEMGRVDPMLTRQATKGATETSERSTLSQMPRPIRKRHGIAAAQTTRGDESEDQRLVPMNRVVKRSDDNRVM